jgi:hypothetical protein
VVEKIGTIKNPLTIIAIFAAIAEVSGTVVLPFIAPVNQATYVWFLIVFPILLVLLFFTTLNFNHRVLYAPSDYKNEENFVLSLQRATYAEKALQVEAELAEIEVVPQAQMEEDNPEREAVAVTTAPEQAREFFSSRRSLQSTYALAEDLIFRKLSREFTTEIQREVRVNSPNSRFIFDGIVYDKGVTTVIDVKLLRQATPGPRLRETLHRIYESVKGLPELQRENFRVLLAIVVDDEIPNHDRILTEIEQYRGELPFPIEVRFYRLSDLESELRTGS